MKFKFVASRVLGLAVLFGCGNALATGPTINGFPIPDFPEEPPSKLSLTQYFNELIKAEEFRDEQISKGLFAYIRISHSDPIYKVPVFKPMYNN